MRRPTDGHVALRVSVNSSNPPRVHGDGITRRFKAIQPTWADEPAPHQHGILDWLSGVALGLFLLALAMLR